MEGGHADPFGGDGRRGARAVLALIQYVMGMFRSHLAKAALTCLGAGGLAAWAIGCGGAVSACAPSSPAALAVARLPTSQRVVALTFDAGADRGYAPQILDTLSRTGASGSFSVTGKWARENPDLVKRMAQAGGTIINHTYDHRSFTGTSTQQPSLVRAARNWEISTTDRVLTAITGMSTKPYFRPPYGDLDACARREVKAAGYRYIVMWSVDSLGWYGLSRAKIERRVLTRLRPGQIYLFHVGHLSQDAAALPDIIRQVRARGYRFATVGDYFR